MNRIKTFILLTLLLLLAQCSQAPLHHSQADPGSLDRRSRSVYRSIDDFLDVGIRGINGIHLNTYSRIDTILIDRRQKTLEIQFNDAFGNIAFRETTVQTVNAGIRKFLGRKYQNYTITCITQGQNIEALVPNYFRSHPSKYDRSRMPERRLALSPLVQNASQPWSVGAGLGARHIALWHSHGWYYENKLDRWEWQRARVFQTVEDLLPMSFTLPYLVPMLENAGAVVLMPRERDLQVHEVIVDNDTKTTSDYTEQNPGNMIWSTSGQGLGFALGTPPYEAGDNPFRMGSYVQTSTDSLGSARITWTPHIPESGRYAVYVSYATLENSLEDAHYTVVHRGGKTEFMVNQTMGGNTWIYLGTFSFEAGKNSLAASVALSNRSRSSGKIVTADAVRFGGGMGNIARNGKISERPRFTEGARYYLQYAGMPDTLVYSLNEEESDYRDDYQCRGEWVNYLRGAPYGPNKDRMHPGLSIPIDLSLAFHTDAGFTRNDTVIGTLGIYSSEDGDEQETFPDGMSRMANRDLTDILQTQLVEDIRALYDPAWNRRMIWNRGYSEAFRPNVPSTLLELLSHHNFLDMKFANDPRFKFDVSRSIYKAMLRFLATQDGLPYVVQPLPVRAFQAEFSSTSSVVLQWEPTTDRLEPTANPTSYVVYTRVDKGDFDNGVLVEENEYVFNDLQTDRIYSFKVCALNEGGLSFPSEILSVCRVKDDEDPVLIINAFDRISAAGTIETDTYLGFADFKDQGVPDRVDINYIGTQYDLMADSPWLDDDAPGHGASYEDQATTLIPGNSFDFPTVHGHSLQNAGKSFVSVSEEAVEEGMVELAKYPMIDLILGEEKEVAGPKPASGREFRAFTKALQDELSTYLSNSGKLMVTGSYVGMDLFDNGGDSLDQQFGQDVLKFKFRTDHAVKHGKVHVIDESFKMKTASFEFNTDVHPTLYAAESPDAIEPGHPDAKTLMRYSENNTSAAVGYQGAERILIFGFPFETIIGESSRNDIMQAALLYLQVE